DQNLQHFSRHWRIGRSLFRRGLTRRMSGRLPDHARSERRMDIKFIARLGDLKRALDPVDLDSNNAVRGRGYHLRRDGWIEKARAISAGAVLAPRDFEFAGADPKFDRRIAVRVVAVTWRQFGQQFVRSPPLILQIERGGDERFAVEPRVIVNDQFGEMFSDESCMRPSPPEIPMIEQPDQKVSIGPQPLN